MSLVCVDRMPVVLLCALLAAACDGHPHETTAAAGASPLGPPEAHPPGPHQDAVPMTNPFAPDDATALNDGRGYFGRYNCAGCHGDHGGGGMGPSLRDETWLHGGDDASIFASIVEGRPHGMPAWGTRLPNDVTWKLVAYVRSLRTSNEPAPADQTIPIPRAP